MKYEKENIIKQNLPHLMKGIKEYVETHNVNEDSEFFKTINQFNKSFNEIKNKENQLISLKKILPRDQFNNDWYKNTINDIQKEINEKNIHDNMMKYFIKIMLDPEEIIRRSNNGSIHFKNVNEHLLNFWKKDCMTDKEKVLFLNEITSTKELTIKSDALNKVMIEKYGLWTKDIMNEWLDIKHEFNHMDFINSENTMDRRNIFREAYSLIDKLNIVFSLEYSSLKNGAEVMEYSNQIIETTETKRKKNIVSNNQWFTYVLNENFNRICNGPFQFKKYEANDDDVKFEYEKMETPLHPFKNILYFELRGIRNSFEHSFLSHSEEFYVNLNILKPGESIDKKENRKKVNDFWDKMIVDCFIIFLYSLEWYSNKMIS